MKSWAWRVSVELLVDDVVTEGRTVVQGASVEHVPLDRHAVSEAGRMARRAAAELLQRQGVAIR
ncbi:MAG TPA: hypothetical protein VGQ58_04215 [Candidatus Limnocylindrales bacterium]|jgi:hypothetical protein|nr:hypothetical protein [Candidatus Limnocylindrales bacterium]